MANQPARNYECVKKYSHIRGFHYALSHAGPHGITLWVTHFDADRYRFEVRKGKEKFPALNMLIISLSFDAWCVDRQVFLKNLNTAFTILKEEGIQAIPRYFNSCFGCPSSGGYTAESVQEHMLPVYRLYMQDCLRVLADKNILIHDISNEPLNNTYGSRKAQERIWNFIKAMHEEIKACDDRPTTVGTQGYIPSDDDKMRQGWLNAKDHNSLERVVDDIAFFEDFLDVITIHPYNVNNLPIEEFEAYLCRKLDYWEKIGKPILITESCWGTPDAESRRSYLESEIPTYKKLGIGFSCHCLNTSDLADRFPLDDRTPMKQGLYMAFLDENYEIRPYHDIYND